MYLPDSIARCVSALPYEESGIGMSGSKVLCYENMVLKIGTDMAAIFLASLKASCLPRA